MRAASRFVNDFLRKNVKIREIVSFEALVLMPKDVEAGFIDLL